MEKYKVVKVFKCRDMPRELEEDFAIKAGEMGASNGVYIPIYVDDDPISMWLKENGAAHDEKVLIAYNW